MKNKDEFYHQIDTLVHRVARVTGDIVKEQNRHNDATTLHLRDLLFARAEILELINTINDEGGDTDGRDSNSISES